MSTHIEITYDQLGFLFRIAAAVVWTMLFMRAVRLQRDRGGYFRRVVMLGTMAAILWGLTLRGASIIGLLPSDQTGILFTSTVFMAIMAGIALLTTQPDPA